jgi:copper chaperone CopZ
MTRLKLKIKDMHCTACAMNIDFDLEDLLGVKSASTNYAKSESVIEYDPTQTTPAKIVACVKSTGYTAVLE